MKKKIEKLEATGRETGENLTQVVNSAEAKKEVEVLRMGSFNRTIWLQCCCIVLKLIFVLKLTVLILLER